MSAGWSLLFRAPANQRRKKNRLRDDGTQGWHTWRLAVRLRPARD